MILCTTKLLNKLESSYNPVSNDAYNIFLDLVSDGQRQYVVMAMISWWQLKSCLKLWWLVSWTLSDGWGQPGKPCERGNQDSNPCEKEGKSQGEASPRHSWWLSQSYQRSPWYQLFTSGMIRRTTRNVSRVSHYNHFMMLRTGRNPRQTGRFIGER